MYVRKLKLQNFRNYEKLELSFSKNVNIIHGNNAQGKTNIVESIYMCATARSHRTHVEKELIKWNCEESHIQLELCSQQDSIIDIHFKKNGKKGIAIDKYPIQKLNQLYGIMNVIMFSPEDLGIITNGPKQRRRFLDIELCQIDPIYFYNIQQYHKILKQRNHLLKKNGNINETISIWDEQLVKYGNKIVEIRQQFIDRINIILNKIHKSITGDKEVLVLKYEKNIEPDYYLKKLQLTLDRDKKFGSTSTGPHRDDILFYINGIDMRVYGSQGQKRTVALSLKLAEIEIVKEILQYSPILILDDVFSELDKERQKYLIDVVQDIQTIITCTDIDNIPNKVNIDRVFKVEKGRLV